MLRLTIHGRFSLRDAGGMETPLNSAKGKALLAYLALSPDMTRSREEIMALLWSDRAEAQARASLRQVLHGLKKALPDETLAIDDSHVALNPAEVGIESNTNGAILLSGLNPGDKES